MKNYLVFAWSCFFLATSACLQAQTKKLIPKSYGTSASALSLNFSSRDKMFSCTTDTIILTTQAQINNFSTNYPTCTTPKYLIIDGTGASPAITNLTGLSSITQVLNKLVISHTSITSLSTLTNLSFIGDTLQLEHNALMTGIGLNNLTQLGSIILRDLPVLASIAGLSDHITSIGQVEIDSTALTNLNGLSGIQHFTDGLYIFNSPDLTSLDGLASLEIIQNSLWLQNLPSLTSISLHNLTQCYGFLFIDLPSLASLDDLSYHLTNTVSGTFWIINTGLTDLSGLDSITSVPDFRVSNNANMVSLHGLEQLTGNIQNGLAITGNVALTDISALNGINTVSDGTVEIGYNNSLSNLIGLGNITNIGGGLWIKAQPDLSSLGDLNNNLVIYNNNGNDVLIFDNNSLSLCSFPPICNYLSAGGNADIHNNDPGCDDITEILAACSVSGTTFTWTGAVNDEWANPGNWLSTTIPTIYDSVLIPGALAIYPYLTANITVGQLAMAPGSELHGNGFAFTVNGSAIMESAIINGAGILNINNAAFDSIQNCNITADVNILNYRGHFYFYDNTITGNTIIKDSSEQVGDIRVDGNTFHGNLSIIHNNSINGNNNFFEGAGSPSGTGDQVFGDLDIRNNSNFTAVQLAANHGLYVSGNLTYTSNGNSTSHNFAHLFANNSSVDGNLSVTQNYGAVTIGHCNIGGTINVIADSTQEFTMHNVANGVAGGSIHDYGGNFVTFSGDQLKADVTCTGITGAILLDNFYVTGNAVFADSAAALYTFTNSAFNGCVFTGDLSITKNTIHNDFVSSNITVTGNTHLTNNSPRELRFGNISIFSQLGGDLTTQSNNPNIILGIINFTGNTDAHLKQSGSAPQSYFAMVMNKTNGSRVILDQTVHTGSLSLGSGIIKTESNKVLLFGNFASAGNGNDSSYVDGPVRKIGHSPFTYPVGDSGRYAPVSITRPFTATDTITVQYFRKNPVASGYDTASHVPGIGKVSAKEYWMINRSAGSVSSAEITLSYNSNRSGTLNQLADLRVAHWNGTQWLNEGNGGTTGNTTSATVKTNGQISSFSPFTLAFNSTPVPVITIGEVNDTLCLNSNVLIPFTVDTPALNNNRFIVQISDAAGVFPQFPFELGSLTSTTSGSINASISPFLTAGGQYRIRIIGTNPVDTSVNIIGPILLSRIPQNTFTISGATLVCYGNQTYTCSNPEAGTTYSWQVSGGGTITPSGSSANINWTTAGTYSLTLIKSNLCGNGPQQTIQVVVSAPAAASAPVINNAGRWLYASSTPSTATNQWYRNGNPISGAVNTSYYASLAGDYTARYSNFCGISPVSNTISFAAAAIAQTINFPAIPNKVYDDTAFTLTASATSGLPVSFMVESGPVNLNTQTNLLTITGTGLVTIKAYQHGDNVYDTAVPVSRNFTVNKASQLITFPAIANQNFGNPPVTLSASSTSGLPITYTVVSGPATISGNLVTLTGAGTVTIRASQGGDTNYLAAIPVDKNFCTSITNLDQISGYSNLCPGPATYTINNIPGATYLWRIAGGSTLPSTANSANITWTTPGVYSLLVSASGNCGTASVNDTLVVNVINSILPDSVHAMLPADGSINQQLPLTLSWVPAQPANFYTFDIYIWRADTAQPAVPFVSNITTVNYTIPLNSGLAYNRTYKWMVVAHNGSCIQINTGPIQQFSLIPLPDLVVNNVQAPATAFSGQSISISWTVSNIGPGRTTTNQNWTDAVFLSFDSIPNFTVPPNTSPGAWSFLDFPVRPLLIATVPNVSALDSGQHYNNSVNFTLPLHYSQPLFAYVITNYPAGLHAPIQVTVSNDTARSPQPVIVTLSPTPDLRVDTVFTPFTTFSGSTINLTYKVKNYGVLTPATSAWTDRIYISQSPLFNINTAIPVKFPKFNDTYYANTANAYIQNSSQLLADSFYTRNMQVVVPNYIFGTYFIYVLTNADNSLYEGASINNNVNRSQLQVFLTPTPHLTVSSLTVPVTTASTTQPIGVNWNISNAGFNDNIEKNKGHYIVFNNTCLIPGVCVLGQDGFIHCAPSTPGINFRDSVSLGSSYWLDRVYLSTDSTGLNVNTAILVNQTEQGLLNSGLNVPDNYTSPATLECKPVATNGSSFNLNTHTVIKPGSNHPRAGNFTVPPGLPQGDYYVYVLTNATKTVYEYPGNPETRRSALPISIQRPDAIVATVSIPGNTVGAQPLSINYTVVNNGPGTVFNHFRSDNIYVSASPVFNASAQLITTLQYVEDLPVGASVSHTLNYTFPVSTSGARYFYVVANADSAFKETNSLNNITMASTLVSPGAASDFIVSSIQLGDTVLAVVNTPFKYTVANVGAGAAAGGWTDSIFISCSPVFNPATSYYVIKRLHNQIVPAGSSYIDSFSMNTAFGFDYNSCFPQGMFNTAYFFVKTNANNGIYEGSNGNNNVTGTSSRVLLNTMVDHIVTTVTAPDTATVGRPYLINWTVKNLGYNPGNYAYYGFWYDALYFSTDSVLSVDDASASFNGEGNPLNRNQTYNDSKNTTTPNIPTGDYYVFVNTNNNNTILGERILSNNNNLVRNGAGAAKKIHVIKPLLPDLTDSIVTAPSLVATGQPITIKHRVRNIGAGVTYPATWSDAIWLSADFIPGNAGDILLSAKNRTGVLQPGQYYDDSTTATIALNITAGSYVLISQVNAANNVFENDGNNNLAFKYITIYSPAPSDLVVENIMKPDTVYLGYTLDTARWIIRNSSPNAATGFSSDGIYLSQSGVLDSTAVLLGIKTKVINMAPLARDTISLQPLLTNVTEGNYNVIVKTDLLNNIVESNKNNNTGIAVSQLNVQVKELPMNVLTPNTLHNINRFYKLIIPDLLSGSTLLVTLRSGDSLTMKNQLFIGKGYIPSAAHFDYAYPTPNYGNQEIVMASVTTGVYYITIRCVSPTPVIQNITLKAVKLPFAILNVQSGSGGSTGNVTVKISGSLFTNNMTAKLSKPGTTITASAIYFSNSTTIYATFNLQGRPLGIYDVTLSKPDTTTAVLVNAFSVVNANNGGLITGGGINTGSGNGNAPGCDPGAASGLNSQLVIEIACPEGVFAGWPFVMQVNYHNPTNVDIPAQVRIVYSQLDIKMALTPEGVANGTTSLYLELTEQGGPPGIIRAGGSGTISIYAKAPLTVPAHTFVLFNLK